MIEFLKSFKTSNIKNFKLTENILPNTGSRHDAINSFFHNL